MLTASRAGSSFFLMAIAVDRYTRAVHPHHPISSLSMCKAGPGASGLGLIVISKTAHVFTLQDINTSYCESFTIDTEPNSNMS
ncbi:Hydroxycarboxylic acid receptor 2 [Oryzias melastigma]|uniref:Hydroxycarboxylic acid receptor 2 n=1 Tax=Oryzias melastigma TaxID=30732 RepID=A0A834F608_ORYME|nr:Hydroxycarboxylic acid receptor 2 [Oryzias melastigma]